MDMTKDGSARETVLVGEREDVERKRILRDVLVTLDTNSSINLQMTYWLNEFTMLHGVNYMTYRMLRCLYKHPDGIEPSVVADYLIVFRQTITNISDELESSGLLIKKPHPSDRRRILLLLTEKGLELSCKLIEEMDRLEQRVFEQFTKDEMQQYLSLRMLIMSRTEEEIKKISKPT